MSQPVQPRQPNPSPERTQQVLVRLDPTFYILSCRYIYYCSKTVMLVQSAWVHRLGGGASQSTQYFPSQVVSPQSQPGGRG